jgi:hypothetical protein
MFPIGNLLIAVVPYYFTSPAQPNSSGTEKSAAAPALVPAEVTTRSRSARPNAMP